MLTRHKLGVVGLEIYHQLLKVYPGTIPDLSTIYRWIREIEAGTFGLTKGATTGRPISTSSAANIQKSKG